MLPCRNNEELCSFGDIRTLGNPGKCTGGDGTHGKSWNRLLRPWPIGGHQSTLWLVASLFRFISSTIYQWPPTNLRVNPTNFVAYVIELDDGKILTGNPLYLMVKTMVSCRFSLKPIQWLCPIFVWLDSVGLSRWESPFFAIPKVRGF